MDRATIQMSGGHAYATCWADYENYSPEEITRFTSLSEFVRHAEKICEEKEIMYNDKEQEKILAERDAPDI